MDNFNWGVRRQSISRLEGTEEAGEVMFCLLFGHRSCLSTRIFDFTDIFF